MGFEMGREISVALPLNCWDVDRISMGRIDPGVYGRTVCFGLLVLGLDAETLDRSGTRFILASAEAADSKSFRIDSESTPSDCLFPLLLEF
jgi:hypothetical protein